MKKKRRSRVEQLNDFLGTNYKNLTDIDWKNSIKFYVDNSSKIATTWFLNKFKDCVNWDIIIRNIKLSTEVMRRIRDYSKIEFSLFGGWTDIIEYQSIEEDFIDEFYYIIEEYIDEDDYWSTIFANQELTEGFIKDHCGKPWWRCTSGEQELSMEFLEKYKNLISWGEFCSWRVITEDLYNKFEEQILKNLDDVISNQPFFESYLKDSHKLLIPKENKLYSKFCENNSEFIGYIMITPLSSEKKFVNFFTDIPKIQDPYLYYKFYKVKIKWKDLVFTYKIELNKYEIIREVKDISSTH